MKLFTLVALFIIPFASAVYAQESGHLKPTDAQTVFTKFADTSAYERTSSYEIVELNDVKCELYVDTSRGGIRSLCEAYDNHGGQIVVSEGLGDGGRTLFSVLTPYGNVSGSGSLLEIDNIRCSLDLVALRMDMGDISIACRYYL